MLKLREDLVRHPGQGDTKYSVRLPESGEVFEFGEREAFLLDSLSTPQDAASLADAYEARFGVAIASSEIEEFLVLLQRWQLVQPASDQPAELEVGDQIQRNNRWHLFRPESAMDVADRWLSPLRPLLLLLPLVLVYGLAAVWFNRHSVVDDLAAAKLHFGVIGHLAFASLTVNLVSQLFRGVTARHYGLSVPSFGVVLEFGLVPRFNTQITPRPGMPRTQRLWLATVSMLVRIVLFAFGLTLWLAVKPSGSFLSTVGAELALISAVGFLFVANPLWRADGYNLLTILLGTPNLKERARVSARGLFRGRPGVIKRYAKHTGVLAIYAVASALFLIALVGFLATNLARRLESDYRGAGVALFVVIVIYVVHNYFRRARAIREQKQRRRGSGNRTASVASGAARQAEPARQRSAAGAADSRRSAWQRWLGYVLLAGLIGCLLLPYQYEVGGEATVYAVKRHEIYAEMDGVIEEVLYHGGEWLTEGTPIARTAKHRQRKDVLATRAAIEAVQHDIERLRSTPSEEAIALAQQQLETAVLQARYSRDEAERIEKLYAKGTVSAQSFDDANAQRDLHEQAVVEKTASLAALRAQINPNEIASAEADLRRLEEELAFFQEQLRRTELRMPITGRIATTKLKELENKYLEEGQLFAEVEDAREVRIEIAVPEAEMKQVEVGDPVRVRTWTETRRIFHGTVSEIAPQATEESYGKVVTVTALLPNPDGLLRTGMTGYAKIQGEKTVLGIAYTKALVRFVLVEVWSWLP